MAKTLAIIFGVVLVLLGLGGFVSNPLIGANALFVTNGATDWLHLVLGVVLLAAGFMAKGDSPAMSAMRETFPPASPPPSQPM